MIQTLVELMRNKIAHHAKKQLMEEINLNYRYRYPRVKFRNGETKYGMLYGIYNKSIKKLEYYFADSSQIRKVDVPNKNVQLGWVKTVQNRINPEDILKVEYLN
jgi:hypothetical protein